ncbi:hypothetical protein CB0940_11381 [Cercospora beticola]|uniref:Uncharacterized protein n=1 Tax=Cercospora beticola TaxID=122368 RepID=A0A2G5HEH6_CERBT|nr:hypothetical protein CB0940_11381 [Cercospora beticola]PIA90956.1 hypothetical protein CB0940_11381 [Cercospora beticola]WPB08228.1 hypothetical protein RHO25_012893 [Cercospora beticola]CAK1367897.1 unnamed protein product [Cercospora beticola]
MSGLWNKDRPSDNEVKAAQQAATLDRMRRGLIPGTWLQLSAAVPQEKTSPLALSPKDTLPSPAMSAGKNEQAVADLVLDDGGFLSNHAPASRSSSISSAASVSTRSPVFKPVPTVCERETIGLARFRGD